MRYFYRKGNAGGRQFFSAMRKATNTELKIKETSKMQKVMQVFRDTYMLGKSIRKKCARQMHFGFIITLVRSDDCL